MALIFEGIKILRLLPVFERVTKLTENITNLLRNL